MLDKKQIQRQFDRSADSYDGVAQMQRDIVDALFQQSNFSNEVESDQVVLDAGCGTGYALKMLSEQKPTAKLNAIDLAPKMVVQASKVCPQARFMVADIEALPYANNHFDAIVSSSVIQWCDEEKVLEEFQRCLKPGGTLMLSTFTQGTLGAWRSLWGRDNQQRFLSDEQLECMFLSPEWIETRLITRSFEQKFYSFAEAVASIRDLGAGDASPNRSASLMNRAQLTFIKNRVEQVIQQQGYIGLVYQVAFIHAKKRF